MKSIIIARVSTEEQKEAVNSLPAQIARLKKYCQNKEFGIIKEVSFDESAYKDQRNEKHKGHVYYIVPIALLQEAEDNYYITAKYLLELANRAYDLFVSSEVTERRQLIKLVLSNLRVEGKTVRYDALKPLDEILNCSDRQLWLARVGALRTKYTRIGG